MPVKRPLPHRAASSTAALPPTPPRTTHKRKRRSRSRVTDSSSEDDDDHDVPEPASDNDDDRGGHVRKLAGVAVGNKRRKTMTLDAIAEELSEARAEEQFWLGENQPSSSTAVASSSGHSKHKATGSRTTARARSRTRSPSSSPPPAPHLLRRGHTGLISPPPSRRAPAILPSLATPPPTTHKTREKAREKKGKLPVVPERDSPNNPFLEDSPAGSVPATDSSPEPRTPKKHVEKPTISMVFRGVKTQMLNPHYLSEEMAAEQEARARLPVRHPDYSPTDACVPKLLFPEARKHDLARRRAHSPVPIPTSPTPTSSKRTRAGSASSSEGAGPARKKPAPAPGAPGPSKGPEEDDVEVMSAVLAANIAKRMRKGVLADGDAPRTRPSSRSREVPQLPEKDRSDPIKRALGPARRG
ncbi:hypothetical protein L226DRAFT_520383 [Lentinus tigrinus ALCF2SS1-7]|uniref:Uncharacterized protein n=1 Tax=Lentinus tigrinus ALCF2SS1-6 TaxID=1328759 RepID=A0A5C2RPU4_9APHY|nr:hypothetical protein L227DRAFT_568533 [Lentinus tigrinus ALCF2SS1-6]RPD79476.1 hypothetical protein L226DRAFT_520383 [Lentinus tigrinus ALCF2SS1-7]